jgi:hypothetical protein
MSGRLNGLGHDWQKCRGLSAKKTKWERLNQTDFPEISLQSASIWRHFTGFQTQLSCNRSKPRLLNNLKALQITILVRLFKS